MTNKAELELITVEDAEGHPIGWIRPLGDFWLAISGDEELDRARFKDMERMALDANMAAYKALGIWDLRVGPEG